MVDLVENVDGLPNICGSEEGIRQTIQTIQAMTFTIPISRRGWACRRGRGQQPAFASPGARQAISPSFHQFHCQRCLQNRVVTIRQQSPARRTHFDTVSPVADVSPADAPNLRQRTIWQ